MLLVFLASQLWSAERQRGALRPLGFWPDLLCQATHERAAVCASFARDTVAIDLREHAAACQRCSRQQGAESVLAG
jgi:hypothetical protein